MIILAEWLEERMEEARAAFGAGRPAALAMVLGELRGALIARDGNSTEVLTAIDRLGDAEKAAMRGQLAAAREGFDAAADCIGKLIREGAAQRPTAAA
jgi:hypothetical protein